MMKTVMKKAGKPPMKKEENWRHQEGRPHRRERTQLLFFSKISNTSSKPIAQDRPQRPRNNTHKK